MIGVAVKVTEVAGQIVVADAAMLTDGVTEGFTVIVIMLLVAVAGEAQLALLVRITFTWSLLTNEFVVNVLLLVPAFTPFTCH